MKSSFSILLAVIGVGILLGALLFNEPANKAASGGAQKNALIPSEQKTSIASTSTASTSIASAQIAEQLKVIEKSRALQFKLLESMGELKEELAAASAQLQENNAKVEAFAIDEAKISTATE